MTQHRQLYDGISHAAWGYLFLYLDINLGTVSVLPRFVGWLLFLSAIEKLKAERRDLALLRPLGILLAAWSAAGWLASWVGTTIEGRFLPLDLIVGTAGMYFHFQFFTDCAALASAYQQPGDGLDRRLLRWRTIQTVLLTVMALSSCGAEWLGEVWTYAVTVLAVVYVIVGLCLMAALFALRKLFAEGPEPPQIENT